MSDRKLIYCDDAMAAVDKRIAELSQHEAFQRKSALSAVIDVAGVKKHIADIPSVDAVLRGTYNQVVWERDIAIQQLESIGKGLGEQMDDVVKVAHAHWIKKSGPGFGTKYQCSNCTNHDNASTAIRGHYCWFCGARMDEGMKK